MVKDGIIKNGVVYEIVNGDCDTCAFENDAEYKMCGMCNHFNEKTCFKRVAEMEDVALANRELKRELMELNKKLLGKSIFHYFDFYGRVDHCMYTIGTLTLDEDEIDHAIINGNKEKGSIPIDVLRTLANGDEYEHKHSDGKIVISYKVM